MRPISLKISCSRVWCLGFGSGLVQRPPKPFSIGGIGMVCGIGCEGPSARLHIGGSSIS